MPRCSHCALATLALRAALVLPSVSCVRTSCSATKLAFVFRYARRVMPNESGNHIMSGKVPQLLCDGTHQSTFREWSEDGRSWGGEAKRATLTRTVSLWAATRLAR